eukprot:Hpha_TRINITY_DN1917_c0_g1::TRINITY_DN1917_c0_g1_i1::g.30908::m.30908
MGKLVKVKRRRRSGGTRSPPAAVVTRKAEVESSDEPPPEPRLRKKKKKVRETIAKDDMDAAPPVRRKAVRQSPTPEAPIRRRRADRSPTPQPLTSRRRGDDDRFRSITPQTPSRDRRAPPQRSRSPPKRRRAASFRSVSRDQSAPARRRSPPLDRRSPVPRRSQSFEHGRRGERRVSPVDRRPVERRWSVEDQRGGRRSPADRQRSQSLEFSRRRSPPAARRRSVERQRSRSFRDDRRGRRDSPPRGRRDSPPRGRRDSPERQTWTAVSSALRQRSPSREGRRGRRSPDRFSPPRGGRQRSRSLEFDRRGERRGSPPNRHQRSRSFEDRRGGRGRSRTQERARSPRRRSYSARGERRGRSREYRRSRSPRRDQRRRSPSYRGGRGDRRRYSRSPSRGRLYRNRSRSRRRDWSRRRSRSRGRYGGKGGYRGWSPRRGKGKGKGKDRGLPPPKPRRQETIIINGVEHKSWPEYDIIDDYRVQQKAWLDGKGEPEARPGRFQHPKVDDAAKEVMAGLHFEAGLAKNYNFVPHGLIYQPDFLTEEEERKIMEGVDSRLASNWRNEKNRRTQQYGFEFFRDHVTPAKFALPDWAEMIAEKVVQTGLLEGPPGKAGMMPNQLIVNEYYPGQGILAHSDRPCFGEEVVILSLLSDLTMSFTNGNDDMAKRWGDFKKGECLLQLLQRRSLVVFKGAARHKWRHGIAESAQDIGTDGKVFDRTRRVSLTFRYVDDTDPVACQAGKWGGPKPKSDPDPQSGKPGDGADKDEPPREPGAVAWSPGGDSAAQNGRPESTPGGPSGASSNPIKPVESADNQPAAPAPVRGMKAPPSTPVKHPPPSAPSKRPTKMLPAKIPPGGLGAPPAAPNGNVTAGRGGLPAPPRPSGGLLV